MVPSVISHYEILEKIGEGGMGVVYKARDTKLDRFVALKFLPPHVASSGEEKARFLQEAKAVAALTHPNICTIHSVEEHDGQAFIVMEYLEGKTLKEMSPNLPLKQAIDIGMQIADGLAAAHEKGIVHRDIKPDNIMIRKDGRVQIMDFGLAKLRGVSRLTREGSTLGTAGYMSPEQIQGHDTDHRTDIFSLGVVLYEMFAGESPFKGVHETALTYEIVNTDPVPLSALKPEMDPQLDAIVLECLEKEPSERYQSVAEVAKDLRRVKRESSRSRVSRVTSVRTVPSPVTRERVSTHGMNISSPADTPAWRKFFWPGLAAALAVALIIVILSPWKHGSVSRTVTRAAIVLPRDQILNTTAYNSVAISPDGSLIVYKSNTLLYLRRIGSFSSAPIPGTEEGSAPFFSPDGKWIGFFAGGKLKKVPVSGGAAMTLAESGDNRAATWGKGGEIVFAPQPVNGLMIIREGESEAKPLTVTDSTKNERTHRWPHFLPDGKTVIYSVGSMDSPDFYDDASVEAVNIETGARKVLMKGGCSPQYVSTGFLVYWRSSSLFAVPFDPGKLEVTGTSFPVLENVNGDPTTGMACYAFSQNGTLAYIPGNAGVANECLVRADVHGVLTPLTAPLQSYMEPRISPDGSKIAVSIESGKDSDIWIYDIPRNTLSKLTFGGVNRTPAWSPDGKRIAYYAYNAGNNSVVVRPADGSGVPEVIAHGRGRTYVDSWSRDGSVLLLDVIGTTLSGPNGPAGSDIDVLHVEGDHVVQPFLETQFDEYQASLSPDGKWIAYTSNAAGSYQVYIQPYPKGGGTWSVSTGEGYGARWAPDGKTLYYYAPGKLMAAPIQTAPSLVVGKPVVVLNDYEQKSIDSGLMFDVFPDGLSFVILQSKDDEENLRKIHLVLNWFDEIQGKMR